MSNKTQSAISVHMDKSIEQLCMENQKESADLLQILAVDSLRYLRVTNLPACEDTTDFYYSKTQQTLLMAILDAITASPLVADARKKQANYLYGSIICRMTFLETINAIHRFADLSEAKADEVHKEALNNAEGYFRQR